MGSALLASWPWDNLGFYKYVLYGPLVGKALASRAWEAASPDRWILLLLVLFGLRALTYQLWSSFSNMLFTTRRRRIVRDGVDFEQIDKEWDWDDFLILQVLMAATAFYAFPPLRHLPLWDARGLALALLVHVAATEPLFYAAHRAFHAVGHLYACYHSLHHSSKVPQPFTAGFATPLEGIVLGALMALPLAAACAAGCGSVVLAFGYMLGFDFLRAMGHCNVEVFPSSLFQAIPVLRYLIYTPTYHTIHHTKREANFCLFMPLFDLLGGTLDDHSWEMQKQTSAGDIDLNLDAPHNEFDLNLPLDEHGAINFNFEAAEYGGLNLNLEAGEDYVNDSNLDTPVQGASSTRRRKDVPKGVRDVVYQTLLAKSKNGRLQKHVTREVAAQFDLHVRTVQRLWRRGKANLAQGIKVDIAGRKKGRAGRKTIPIDLERLRDIPLKDRMTLQDVSKHLGISLSKLKRYMKQGLIRRYWQRFMKHAL